MTKRFECSEIHEKSILLFGGCIIGLLYAVLPKYPLPSFVMFGIVLAFTYLLVK